MRPASGSAAPARCAVSSALRELLGTHPRLPQTLSCTHAVADQPAALPRPPPPYLSNPYKNTRTTPQGLRPGALDPDAAASHAKRQRELADRQAYLKNFWCAASLPPPA